MKIHLIAKPPTQRITSDIENGQSILIVLARMNQNTSQEFSARIKKAGINPYVDIPSKVSRAFGKLPYVPVRGNINDTPIIGTLVPTGGGRHRLYINMDMRKKSGTKVGDRIFLSIEFDAVSRPMILPVKLQQALGNNTEAKIAWEELPPSRRKEMLAYLNYLKTPAALEGNIKKVIDILTRQKKTA